jgi:hypothetical protein
MIKIYCIFTTALFGSILFRVIRYYINISNDEYDKKIPYINFGFFLGLFFGWIRFNLFLPIYYQFPLLHFFFKKKIK